jgi:hypothetical protein
MEQNPSWEANNCSASQKNSEYIMEPEGFNLFISGSEDIRGEAARP